MSHIPNIKPLWKILAILAIWVLCMWLLGYLSGCSKMADPGNGWREYTINEGQHGSQISKDPILSKSSYAITAFHFPDSSCVYDLNGYDQWNKLDGMIERPLGELLALNNPLHENSARFAWRWIPGSGMQIAAYGYFNNKDTIRPLAFIDIGPTSPNYYAQITALNGRYIYWLGDWNQLVQWIDSTPRAYTTTRINKWRAGFYFGGQYPAPHPMRVWKKPLFTDGLLKSNSW
jgi:hypothetical protein